MRSVLLLLLAVLAWSDPLLAKDHFRYPEARYGKAELKYIGDIPVLTLEGNPTEMGEQLGTLALKPAAEFARLVQQYAKQQIPAALMPAVSIASHAMYSRFPIEYQQELTAAALAAGVNGETLELANTMIDMEEMVGCSSMLVSSQRSSTGGPLYCRNVDVPYVKGLSDFSLLVVYRPKGKLSFAMPNLPGLLMCASGMNSHGLALGSQSVDAPNDGSARFDATGIASAVAGRRLMEECKTVDDARAWLEKNRLARCVSIAACDRDRQEVFEVTTRRLLTRPGELGLCYATNHFRLPGLATSLTCWRYDRLSANRNQDKYSVDDVAKLMDSVNQGIATIHTMVFEPVILHIHLSMGPPPASAHPLVDIDLAGLLNGVPDR